MRKEKQEKHILMNIQVDLTLYSDLAWKLETAKALKYKYDNQ
jgi:hypothetical protein